MSIERSAPSFTLRAVWRDLGRFLCEALAAGLIVSLVLALAAFIVSTQAQAAEASGSGELRLRSANGASVLVAPLVSTAVEIDISGNTARASVTQVFRNPTTQWREGVYVFPLPENAAVDHLDMRVGNRRIEGEIKERAQAKAAYEQAKQEGRKATLVEQERPNMFTTSVANIGPDEEIRVSIEYQQTLRYDDGRYRLRFPMVVSPRYIAGDASVVGVPGTGSAANTDRVPDAERITPPVIDPSQGKTNPVTLTVTLNAGFPLAEVLSPYHPIDVVAGADDRYHVMLADGAVPADRDFELVWKPQLGREPAAALLSEVRDGKTYALLMLMPPAASDDAPRLPREVVCIVDTSGSMEGASIAQAKAAVSMALDRLQPGDRFNVIEFNSVTRTLFARADAGRRSDDRAGAHVRREASRRRRHGDEAGARSGAHARRRARLRAPGRVSHRWRRRQRSRALLAHRRAPRRPAAVHDRHRLGTQFAFHDRRPRSSVAARTRTSATCGKSARR